MPIIKVETINVNQIFDDAFTALTQKVSGVEVTRCTDIDFSQKTHRFVVKTKGMFQGQILAELEHELLGAIGKGINKGRKLQEAEKILFAMEYLNIVCGRALSEINNQTGTSSRLTVPQYITGKMPEKMSGSGYEELCYQSEYGKLNIKVIYKLERKG